MSNIYKTKARKETKKTMEICKYTEFSKKNRGEASI
jgi:predicted nucleic-acid-binding Zn-ribbon protein